MDAAVPAVGDLAPDFALDDARGNPCRLSELTAGCLLVLIFYRGHW
jgi:peroxiredoxin